MQRPTRSSRLSFAAALPAAVVLLGAALRFMQMGLIRYGYDQSYPAFQAVALLDGGVWPLIGQPSSVFLDNPALMAHLQAKLREMSDGVQKGTIAVVNAEQALMLARIRFQDGISELRLDQAPQTAAPD